MARPPPPLFITQGDVHILNELLHSPVGRQSRQHLPQPPLLATTYSIARPSLPVTPDLVLTSRTDFDAPYRQSTTASSEGEWTQGQRPVVLPDDHPTSTSWLPPTQSLHHISVVASNTSAPSAISDAPKFLHDAAPTLLPHRFVLNHPIHDALNGEFGQSHTVKHEPSSQHQEIHPTSCPSPCTSAVLDGYRVLPLPQVGATQYRDIAPSHHTQLSFGHQNCQSYRSNTSLPPLQPLTGTPTNTQEHQADMRKPPRTCKVAKCMKTIQRHGLCHKHGGVRRCINQGCTRKDRGEGYCVTHGGGKRCAVKGCGKVVRRGTFCLQHTDPGSSVIAPNAATQVA